MYPFLQRSTAAFALSTLTKAVADLLLAEWENALLTNLNRARFYVPVRSFGDCARP